MSAARRAGTVALIGIVATLSAASAAAQAPAKCAPLDTTATWYRAQKAWMDDSPHSWTNDSLRTALLTAAGINTANPNTIAALVGYEITPPLVDGPASADAEALAALRTLAQTRGSTWPTRSVVGAAGVRAVWMLTARDTMLARVALHRMMEAGGDESPPAAIAILEDRLRIQAGRKQLYGTQLVRRPDGSLELAPIEDPKHVDLRRDAAELPPLAQALCAARTAGTR